MSPERARPETDGHGISSEKGKFLLFADMYWRPRSDGGTEGYYPDPGDEEPRAGLTLPGDFDEYANPTDQLYARRQYCAAKAAWLLAARSGMTTVPAPEPLADGTDVRSTPDGKGLVVVLPDASQVWRDAEWRLHRDDGPAVERPNGQRSWWRHGDLHRTDGPAIEHADGSREWWVEGRRHRMDGPAQDRVGGTRAWWVDGKRHRTEGPAVELPDGTREWWVDGQRHRVDGPAVEKPDGTREWYRGGVRHREGGPAVEYPDGYRVVYVNGRRHRVDGPAVEGTTDKRSWWLNGVNVSEDEVRRAAQARRGRGRWTGWRKHE